MTEYMLLHTKNIECPLHFNAELEILFVKSGTVTVSYDTEIVCVPAGQAILISPYKIHSFKPDINAQATVFMFSYSIAEEWFRNYKVSNIVKKVFPIDETLQHYIAYALVTFENNPHTAIIKSIFYAFISEYIRYHSYSSETPSEHNITDAIIHYLIDGNSDTTLTEVCKVLGLNKKKVAKLVMDTYGINFSELVNDVRLAKASALLLEGNLSMTEIAFQAGFGSLRSFNRIFAQEFKCTPTEYRKKKMQGIQ